MSLQLEKLEKNMGKLTIEVAVEEVEAAMERAYHKNKGRINVPGFRKGKVPRKMIEKMYGPEIFYDDAANDMIQTAYAKAYDECEEEIVSSPKIDVVQLETGKSFVFTAEVALKPEVTLGKYKGVKVDKVEIKVTEEEVNQELESEREKNARTIVVEDRAVQSGDMLIIDFEGFVDDVAFSGGKAEGYSLTIGSNSFIPGFEDQLIGVKIGEDVEVNVSFPEEYHAEELKGKPAVFKCKVHEIKAKELPELDDEFACEVSEFDTLSEYKEDIESNILKRKETELKRAKEEQAMTAVIDGAKMEIPDAMVEAQQRQMADEYAQRIQMQGLNIEQYFQFSGLTHETFLAQMKPQALNRIQSRLVLEAVVVAESIVPSEEDYEAELVKMASMYQMELEKVREMMGDSQKEEVMKEIAMTKASEVILENAKETKPTKARATKVDKEEKETKPKATKAKATTKKTEDKEATKKPAAKKTATKKKKEE
ncbi:MAG: trigger factor [Eubacteriales bacterium]